MGAVHGSNADVLGNGYLLSEYLNNASFHGTRDSAETTTFKKQSKTFIPGLKDSTMTCAGVYDGSTNAVDEVLSAALSGTEDYFSYLPEGKEVAGNPGYTFQAIESSYQVTSAVGGVSQISAELKAGDDGIGFERGLVVEPYGAQAVAGNSGSIDNGVQSTNGAALVVHATDATNLVAVLQDSADNSTFADLTGNITIAAGRDSARLFVAGTIRRYVRVRWTGTGTFVALVNRK